MSTEFDETNAGGDAKMGVEYDNAVIIDLEGGGVGSISLKDRLNSGELGMADIEAATEKLAGGGYSVKAEVADVTKCGDGRPSDEPTEGTQLFGGTAGLIKSFIGAGLVKGKSAIEAIAEGVKERTKAGKKSGAHTADTHGKPGCGCGECDGAEAATNLMIEAQDTVKGLVEGLYGALDIENRLGFGFSEDEFNSRFDTFKTANDNEVFANGKAQVTAVAENSGEEKSVEHLEGSHGEVIWVINMREGTRFDREKFVQDHAGKNIQAFWEDQWAAEDEFRQEADGDEATFQSLVMADLMRRVATAANLTKADLRIIVLR